MPAITTRPESALRNPATIDTRVVLPAPFRPSRAVISPAATSRLTASSAWHEPVRLREPLYVEHARPFGTGRI